MSKIEDGGPAYPMPAAYNPNNEAFTWGHDGMSKREVYAARALQGYIASEPDADLLDPMKAAAWAWQMADAMLATQHLEPAKEKYDVDA